LSTQRLASSAFRATVAHRGAEVAPGLVNQIELTNLRKAGNGLINRQHTRSATAAQADVRSNVQ